VTARQVLERGPENERCSQTHLKRADFAWILRGGRKTSCAIPKFWGLNSVAKIRASWLIFRRWLRAEGCISEQSRLNLRQCAGAECSNPVRTGESWPSWPDRRQGICLPAGETLIAPTSSAVPAPLSHPDENSCSGRFAVWLRAVRLSAGRWPLSRHLPISTNGHRGRENGRPPLAEPSYSRISLPVFHHRLADRHNLPLYLLMSIKSAKVCASLKIFFRASVLATGRDPFRSGYKLALKSPNAHRLAKNDRVAPKKSLARTHCLPQPYLNDVRTRPSYLLNAQRLGKNGRLTLKKIWLRKTYIPWTRRHTSVLYARPALASAFAKPCLMPFVV